VPFNTIAIAGFAWRDEMFFRCCLAALLVMRLFGCDKAQEQAAAPNAPAVRKPAGPPAAVPADFVLKKSPEAAKNLADAKKEAKDGDEVVVTAVVGGSAEPFTAGQAVMQVVDPSVLTCDKMGMGKDVCPTPWDACCHQADVKQKDATVRVLNAEGKPLNGTLEGVGGIAPGKTVIVKGKAHLQDGKLVIDANNVFVKG
jgi:hypothetical protein